MGKTELKKNLSHENRESLVAQPVTIQNLSLRQIRIIIKREKMVTENNAKFTLRNKGHTKI
jgi:hypothetical protein